MQTASQITDTTNIGNVLDFAYNFSVGTADNGNVISIANNRDATRSQNFTYDQLNRVATAKTTSTTGSNCWGLNFGYDIWANLQSASVSQCSVPVLSLTLNTNNQITNPGYSYDVAGNVLGDGSFSYTWNAESEIKAAAGVNYTYDGDGNRVQKSNGKLYWYGAGTEILDESDAGGNISDEYVFFGGKRIAHRVVSGNSVSYYAEDFLGSSRVITTASGSICYDADFYPFGGERILTNTCPQNYKFTGKERDTETGNDDFGARYYSSSTGRWLSPDWSAIPAPVPYATLTNPQTLNLYQFVHNNPETFADIDGHLELTASGVEMLRQFEQESKGDPFDTMNTPTQEEEALHAQNQGEGSQANLARRDAIANSAEDAFTRAQLTQKDPYGANECSRLVSDSIKKAGANAQFTPNDGPARPPVAGEWANPKANIPGWRVLGHNEKPAAGDVAAHALPNPHPGATGDSAIVTRSSKGLTTVHAGEHGILHDPHFIRGNSTGTYSGVVYRRYTGE